MATSKADGSQTAVISTEHTLATITDAGSYVLGVDVSNLALGDKLTLRIKTKVRSAGTTRTTYIAVGAPGSEVLIAENVPTRATTQELMRGPVFVDSLIAEGDRVSARAQCTITDASDRLLSISITGFR